MHNRNMIFNEVVILQINSLYALLLYYFTFEGPLFDTIQIECSFI